MRRVCALCVSSLDNTARIGAHAQQTVNVCWGIIIFVLHGCIIMRRVAAQQ